MKRVSNNTKRIMSAAVLSLMIPVTFPGCAQKNKAPDNWYENTLTYYKEGFDSGWKNIDPADYHLRKAVSSTTTLPSGETVEMIPDDYKDKRFGYLIKDLDGDKTPEVLIGIVDDSAETKITDICIWHNDFGALNSMSTADGYYMYLCGDGIIRKDSWRGSETETVYMKYDPKENSFPIIQPDGDMKPEKVSLKPFDEVEKR